jgi:hypothetical protein
MNTEGVDFWGRPYTVGSVPVPGGEVLPLWVAVVIPADASSGRYFGHANVTFSGVDHPIVVNINLTVGGPFLPNGLVLVFEDDFAHEDSVGSQACCV